LHGVEAIEDLRHQDVEDFVHLQQVKEEQVDHIRKQAGTFAERLMLKHCKYRGKHGIKTFIG